jgi:hypothetical protein
VAPVFRADDDNAARMLAGSVREALRRAEVRRVSLTQLLIQRAI